MNLFIQILNMKPSAAANMAAGLSAAGKESKHDCNTHAAPSKLSKKQIEEEKLKQEQKEQQEKEEKLLREQREQEENELFRLQNTVKLDYMQAFGVYSGTEFNDVFGQVQLVEDPFFKLQEPSKTSGRENSGDLNGLDATGQVQVQEAQKKQNLFQSLKLVYPVGRHLGIKSLDTGLMKFLKLPSDVQNVTAIAFNTAQNLMAVAVRNNDIQGFEQLNLSIYFYSIGQEKQKMGQKKQQQVFELIREKNLTLRVTQGSHFLAPSDYKPKDTRKGSPAYKMGVPILNERGRNAMLFDRYISQLTFSKDDKNFGYVIRNNICEYNVVVFDFLEKKPRKISSEKFTYPIHSIKFMPRDSSKLMIAGENLFNLYNVTRHGFQQLQDFDDMPRKEPQNLNGEVVPQNFTVACYNEYTEQLIGCSNLGDIFIIEIMNVVQVIKKTQLMSPDTSIGTRLNIKFCVACRFGFIAASQDVIYFFKHSQKKGKLVYNCILRWRAQEFVDSSITSLSVQEGAEKSPETECNLAISTKNNQIIYLNLYKQVYFPDSAQLLQEYQAEAQENNEDSDREVEIEQIKTVGISEENTDSDRHQKKASSIESKNAKIESDALIDKIYYETVGGGFHQGEVTCMDICIQRPVIATLSKVDSTVRVWNYDTGKCEIVKSYYAMQKEFKSSNQTYLQSVALHPSGFYMAIAFFDKVKIFHLLDSEIREYRSLDIKNCHKVKFSNGGQYLACVDLKDISVFYSYTLDKPRKMPCPSSHVNNLEFNAADTIISVVSKDGFVQKYDIVKFMKTGECVIDKQCNFQQCIFAQVLDSAGKIKEKLYTVGAQGKQMMIRCYNERENNEVEINFEARHGTKMLTGIVELRGPPETEAAKRARNLIITTDDGKMFVYGTPPNLKHGRECDVMNSHVGAINCIQKSFDNKIVATCGQDGTIFVYRVSEVPNAKIGQYTHKIDDLVDELDRKNKKKQVLSDKFESRMSSMDASQEQEQIEELKEMSAEKEGSPEQVPAEGQPAVQKEQERQDDISEDDDSDMDPYEVARIRKLNQDLYSVIDKKLSNIVLIEKQMMDEWRKQQEQLKLDLEKEENAFESTIRRERYLQDTKIAQMERMKSEQLTTLNKEYEDLQLQEAEEKDENTQTMKKMELNHLQCMEELQQLYEKKLQLEQKQYNDLAKEKEQLKNDYEDTLREMDTKHENATEKLLNEFKINLADVQEQYDNSKRTSDGLKMIYEERLTQTEDDDAVEIRELKRVYEREIQQLNDVIATIRDDIETIKRQERREQEEADMYKRIKDKAQLKEHHRRTLMAERDIEIQKLETEKKEIQNKLKEKEKELYKYKFKIKDLQKTKQVLTHRTQEMKASLEPKEQQIENLKEQLLDLEKVFERQSKALQNLEQDVERRKEKIIEMEEKVKAEKTRTKQKEQVINQFVNDVHKAYKSKNDEVYIKELMNIYNKYVREHTDEILENKKKDPETIEELDRQLQYMEKSIAILKSSTMQNQAKTKVNIQKRRQENNFLISDLEAVRQSKREKQRELEKKTLEIQQLKLDKQKIQREFDDKLQEIEAETLKRVKQIAIAGQEHGNEEKFDEENIYRKPSSTNQDFFSNEQGVPSKVKGKIYKGTPFVRGNDEDKKKIAELEAQIEENNQGILIQKLEKRSLQEQIIRLLDERADDLGLTEEEKRVQLSKLNIHPFAEDQNFSNHYNVLRQNQDIHLN